MQKMGGASTGFEQQTHGRGWQEVTAEGVERMKSHSFSSLKVFKIYYCHCMSVTECTCALLCMWRGGSQDNAVDPILVCFPLAPGI